MPSYLLPNGSFDRRAIMSAINAEVGAMIARHRADGWTVTRADIARSFRFHAPKIWADARIQRARAIEAFLAFTPAETARLAEITRALTWGFMGLSAAETAALHRNQSAIRTAALSRAAAAYRAPVASLLMAAE